MPVSDHGYGESCQPDSVGWVALRQAQRPVAERPMLTELAEVSHPKSTPYPVYKAGGTMVRVTGREEASQIHLRDCAGNRKTGQFRSRRIGPAPIEAIGSRAGRSASGKDFIRGTPDQFG